MTPEQALGVFKEILTSDNVNLNWKTFMTVNKAFEVLDKVLVGKKTSTKEVPPGEKEKKGAGKKRG